MELEALIQDVANSDVVPDASLAALVAHAPALTPRLKELARRRMEGDWLYPSEEGLLFYGLFVLAAARERSFWPTWIEMLTVSDDGLEGLFGDGVIMSVRAITLGLFEGHVDTVAELVMSREIASDARAGLTGVLARLTCEDRFPRDQYVAMVDALADLEGTEDDMRCRWCVEEAIVLAGIGERAELLEHLWKTDDFSIFNDADRADARERLAAAMAHPADMTRFDEDGILAPETPTHALLWRKSIEQHDPDRIDPHALSWREREWLGSLLRGTSAPSDAMCFEELDGFFHALVIGPDLVMPSEYLGEIWGEGPVFDDERQAREVFALFQRHWNAIARRAASRSEPDMWLEPQDGLPAGVMWSRGFERGVDMRSQSWAGVAIDEIAAVSLDCILALRSDQLPPRERSELLYMLGENFTVLSDFWLERRSPRKPHRTRKVGRNDPCPCGSGKKWKKCCGASAPPTMH